MVRFTRIQNGTGCFMMLCNFTTSAQSSNQLTTITTINTILPNHSSAITSLEIDPNHLDNEISFYQLFTEQNFKTKTG